MKFIKQFDLFGHSLTFEEDKSSYFKTNIGSVLSYLMLITIITLGFVLGNEIYNRKSPNLMKGEEIVGKEDSKILLKEFPIILNMSKKFGVPILQDYRSIFNIDILYGSIGTDGLLNFELYYGFSDCEVKNYSEDTQELASEIINGIKKNFWSPFCLIHEGKEDFAIANKYSFIDSSAIFFRITDCDEDAREFRNYVNKDKEVYKSAPKCDPNRREISDSFILFFGLVNSFYNYKSYESPKNQYSYSFMKILGYGITNSAIMHLGIEELFSDNGWLFESLNESRIYYYDTWDNSTFMISKDKEIFMLGIGVNNHIKKSYRTYMKIQELFAKIGGLFNAFFIIVKILLYDYVYFKYHVRYAKYTVDAIDLEKNKEMYPEINTFKKYFSASSKNISIPKDNIRPNSNENHDNLVADKIKADDDYNNINIFSENNENNEYNNNGEKFGNRLQIRNSQNNMENKKRTSLENISVQPILPYQTITNENNNIFSEINYTKANRDEVKKDNFINHFDKNIELQPKLNSLNIHNKCKEKENMNPNDLLVRKDILVNLKFKDENNLIKLNNFLLDKVISMKYCDYFFYSLCGCFYKHKPIGYLIIDSEYSKDKYSMKYYLKNNKKLRSFQRSLYTQKSNPK